jgi:hypothetical protein
MNTFTRGLEPKEAMNIGEASFCKKEYVDKLCSKCKHGKFNWRFTGSAIDPSNKNYCKKIIGACLINNTVSVKIQ